MIVVAASYFEAIVNDFFRQMFIEHPQQMHSAIRPDSDTAKGMIPLRDIVDADSKEMLLDRLAESCSAWLSGLPIQKIVKRLRELSASIFNSKLEERLARLLSHRHRIVHENDKNVVKAEDVLSAFESIEQCANSLAQIAFEQKVDVRWSTASN
jgi:gamma-glutamyl:cysteine ligase YbdK (ATP-grasp superfamily)